MAIYAEERTERERPSFVRWQAVLSGAAVGLAVFFILSALWFALAGLAGSWGGGSPGAHAIRRHRDEPVESGRIERRAG
jgi:hypothetical protein